MITSFQERLILISTLEIWQMICTSNSQNIQLYSIEKESTPTEGWGVRYTSLYDIGRNDINQ